MARRHSKRLNAWAADDARWRSHPAGRGAWISELVPEQWVWCITCGRCYQVGEFYTGGDGLRHCPYVGCDGTYLDVQPWARVCGFHGWPVTTEPQRYRVYRWCP